MPPVIFSAVNPFSFNIAVAIADRVPDAQYVIIFLSLFGINSFNLFFNSPTGMCIDPGIW